MAEISIWPTLQGRGKATVQRRHCDARLALNGRHTWLFGRRYYGPRSSKPSMESGPFRSGFKLATWEWRSGPA